MAEKMASPRKVLSSITSKNRSDSDGVWDRVKEHQTDRELKLRKAHIDELMESYKLWQSSKTRLKTRDRQIEYFRQMAHFIESKIERNPSSAFESIEKHTDYLNSIAVMFQAKFRRTASEQHDDRGIGRALYENMCSLLNYRVYVATCSSVVDSAYTRKRKHSSSSLSMSLTGTPGLSATLAEAIGESQDEVQDTAKSDPFDFTSSSLSAQELATAVEDQRALQEHKMLIRKLTYVADIAKKSKDMQDRISDLEGALSNDRIMRHIPEIASSSDAVIKIKAVAEALQEAHRALETAQRNETKQRLRADEYERANRQLRETKANISEALRSHRIVKDLPIMECESLPQAFDLIATRMDTVKERREDTVAECERRIQKLRNQVSLLQEERQAQNEEITELKHRTLSHTRSEAMEKHDTDTRAVSAGSQEHIMCYVAKRIESEWYEIYRSLLKKKGVKGRKIDETRNEIDANHRKGHKAQVALERYRQVCGRYLDYDTLREVLGEHMRKDLVEYMDEIMTRSRPPRRHHR